MPELPKLDELKFRLKTVVPCKFHPPDHSILVWKHNAQLGKRKDIKHISYSNLNSALGVLFKRLSSSLVIFFCHIIDYYLGQFLQFFIFFEERLDSATTNEKLKINKQNAQLVIELYNKSEKMDPLQLPELPLDSNEEFRVYLRELLEFVKSSVSILDTILINFLEWLHENVLHLLSNDQALIFPRIQLIRNGLHIWYDIISNVVESKQENILGYSLSDWTDANILGAFKTYSTSLFSSINPNFIDSLSNEPVVWDHFTALNDNILSSILDGVDALKEAKLRARYTTDHQCALCKGESRPSDRTSTCSPALISFRFLIPRMLLLPVYQYRYIKELLKMLYQKSNCEKNKLALYELISSMSSDKSFPSGMEGENSHMWVSLYEQRLLCQLSASPLTQRQLLKLLSNPSSEMTLPELRQLIDLIAHGKKFQVNLAPHEYLLTGLVNCAMVTQPSSMKHFTERRVYLFSNCLVICKSLLGSGASIRASLSRLTSAKQSPTQSSEHLTMDSKISLKLLIPLKQFTLIDHAPMKLFSDSSNKDAEMAYLFQVQWWGSCEADADSKTSSVISLMFYVEEEKSQWLAYLSYLQSFKLFQRYASKEYHHTSQTSLLKSHMHSKFVLPDKRPWIVFDKESDQLVGKIDFYNLPTIKHISVYKLLELVTHEVFFDTRLVRIFLHTYRRYLEPGELFQLLLDRFHLPELDFRQLAPTEEAQFSLKMIYQKNYVRKIQYKVLSFISQWLRFDPSVYEEIESPLAAFLNSGEIPVEFRVAIESIHRFRAQKQTKKSLRKNSFSDVVSHSSCSVWDLNSCQPFDSLLHIQPAELAKQITLYEWSLYAALKHWEINGREDLLGPNLKVSLSFSNSMKNWFVTTVLSQSCLQDRLIVMQRLADLYILFEELNNLQGLQVTQLFMQSNRAERSVYSSN
ncbi:hypothetical protein Ciccas_001754 [Cichlidogyrus casuarinus]|uniref:Uncharacterized protein n=1 Tax=Cichlidogyrus casuarinus TaxID=1844966 RepID=A0ABD2QJ77_9PLAT